MAGSLFSETAILFHRHFKALSFQKWYSSGVVSAFSLRKIIEFAYFFGIL